MLNRYCSSGTLWYNYIYNIQVITNTVNQKYYFNRRCTECRELRRKITIQDHESIILKSFIDTLSGHLILITLTGQVLKNAITTEEHFITLNIVFCN